MWFLKRDSCRILRGLGHHTLLFDGVRHASLSNTRLLLLLLLLLRRRRRRRLKQRVELRTHLKQNIVVATHTCSAAHPLSYPAPTQTSDVRRVTCHPPLPLLRLQVDVMYLRSVQKRRARSAQAL